MCGAGGDRFGITDTRYPLARGPSGGKRRGLPYTTKPSTIQFARSDCRKGDKRKTEGRFLDLSPVPQRIFAHNVTK
jgi:hypothetical protein